MRTVNSRARGPSVTARDVTVAMDDTHDRATQRTASRSGSHGYLPTGRVYTLWLMALLVLAGALYWLQSPAQGYGSRSPHGRREAPPCEGAVTYCGKCYSSLASAINAIPCDPTVDNATLHDVRLANCTPMVMYKPVYVHWNVRISKTQGLSCRPRVVAAFNGTALFELVPQLPGSNSHRFYLGYFDMEARKDCSVGGIRAATTRRTDFEAKSMTFARFSTPDGVSGAAVFLNLSSKVYVDSQTKFTDNYTGKKSTSCPQHGGAKSEYCDGCTPIYGGGALCIRDQFGKADIHATFLRNRVGFNHGQGGGIYIRNVTGVVNITGTFTNNTASEGGAIELWDIKAGANVSIKGTFTNNSAVDPQGVCGDRGGAITVRWVRSLVTIGGRFVDNWSPKFGGALRSDTLYDGGHLELGGYFHGNTAEMGSVANLFTLEKGSRFIFNPDEASTKELQGDTKAIYISRSDHCKNAAEPPKADITGCD